VQVEIRGIRLYDDHGEFVATGMVSEYFLPQLEWV